jgi:ketosteroid isomerase-like protein
MNNAERLMSILAPAFGEGELDVSPAFLDELGRRLSAISAEEITGSMTADSTFTTEFEGREGLLETWGDWLETFARVRLEMEAVEEIGDNVLTFVNQVGTTRHGVDVEQPSAAVWKFRDGKLIRVEFHLDRERARASAGEPS